MENYRLALRKYLNGYAHPWSPDPVQLESEFIKDYLSDRRTEFFYKHLEELEGDVTRTSILYNEEYYELIAYEEAFRNGTMSDSEKLMQLEDHLAINAENNGNLRDRIRSILKLDPDHTQARILDVYPAFPYQIDRFRSLIKELENSLAKLELLGIDPVEFRKHPIAYDYLIACNALAESLFWNKKFVKAEKEFRNILSYSDGSFVYARQGLMQVYCTLGERKKASKLFNYYDSFELGMTLPYIILLYKSNKKNEADRLFKRVLELNPTLFDYIAITTTPGYKSPLFSHQNGLLRRLITSFIDRRDLPGCKFIESDELICARFLRMLNKMEKLPM